MSESIEDRVVGIAEALLRRYFALPCSPEDRDRLAHGKPITSSVGLPYITGVLRTTSDKLTAIGARPNADALEALEAEGLLGRLFDAHKQLSWELWLLKKIEVIRATATGLRTAATQAAALEDIHALILGTAERRPRRDTSSDDIVRRRVDTAMREIRHLAIEALNTAQ